MAKGKLIFRSKQDHLVRKQNAEEFSYADITPSSTNGQLEQISEPTAAQDPNGWIQPSISFQQLSDTAEGIPSLIPEDDNGQSYRGSGRFSDHPLDDNGLLLATLSDDRGSGREKDDQRLDILKLAETFGSQAGSESDGHDAYVF